MSDDGCPQSQTVGIGDLSEEFRPAIKILGIRLVIFRIHALFPIKNTIRTDMNEPGTGSLADESNTMRKQGINGNRREWIVGKGELLDNTDTVDDNIRLDRS